MTLYRIPTTWLVFEDELAEFVNNHNRHVSPWFESVSVYPVSGEVTYRAWDHNKPEGEAIIVGEFTFEHLGKALASVIDERPKALCCLDAMRSEGLGYGCAEDADQVLQAAIYGRTIYG